MSIYTIYKITCIVNKKIYIGYTKRKPEHRLYYHIYEALHKTNSNIKLHNAIRKYGKDNFHIEILFQSLDKEYIVNEMEEYFIREYESMNDHIGYNMCHGGQGGDIRNITQKHILSEKMKLNNPSKDENVKRKISNTAKLNHKLGKYKTKKYLDNFEKQKKRFLEDNPGKNKTEETKRKISDAQKKRFLERPDSFAKGENNSMYGRSTWHEQSKEWQNNQKEKIAAMRKSEIHECPYCGRIIKTNGCFALHLRSQHNVEYKS